MLPTLSKCLAFHGQISQYISVPLIVLLVHLEYKIHSFPTNRVKTTDKIDIHTPNIYDGVEREDGSPDVTFLAQHVPIQFHKRRFIKNIHPDSSFQ